MEEEAHSWLIPTSILLLFSLLLSKFILKRQANQQNLPPSPPALPIIGHLHLLKEPLHRSLHELTKKYGHMVFLRLGTRKVLLISSASAVEECFTKNDIIFANRPQVLAGKHLNYNYKTVGASSYGDHWRNLRRLTTLELFSSKRLAMLSSIREEEVHLLLKQLFQESKDKDSVVDLRPKFVELSFNIMLRMISGKRYYGKDVTEEAKEFQSLMKEFVALQGSGNLNDFFPLMQWIDFKGLEKRMVKMMTKMDRFLQKLLDEHRRNKMCEITNQHRKMTMIQVMLDLQATEPEFYTDETVKGVILVSNLIFP